MIGLAYVLGVALAGSVGVIVWLVYGRVQAAEKEADARVGQVATEAESERTAYELDVTRKALGAANIRATALEEELQHALEQPSLSDGLDAHDVAGRVLRLAGRWREAAGTRDPLPAEPGPAVPAGSPTSPTKAADVPHLKPIDVLR